MKCNLARQKIITSKLCELCNEGPEDVLHALWKCEVVEVVWSSHSWSQKALNPPPLTFCDLVDCSLRRRMILGRKSLRCWLGAHGIEETPSTLGD